MGLINKIIKFKIHLQRSLALLSIANSFVIFIMFTETNIGKFVYGYIGRLTYLLPVLFIVMMMFIDYTYLYKEEQLYSASNNKIISQIHTKLMQDNKR